MLFHMYHSQKCIRKLREAVPSFLNAKSYCAHGLFPPPLAGLFQLPARSVEKQSMEMGEWPDGWKWAGFSEVTGPRWLPLPFIAEHCTRPEDIIDNHIAAPAFGAIC